MPEMHRDAEERRQLETELRSALKNGELSLAYQPILASGSQKIEGFEALLRWNHPALGEVPPDKFVPIAEEAGLRSEEHTSELQSLMRISYAVFCLKKKK